MLSLLTGALAVTGYFLLPGVGRKDAGYSVIGLVAVLATVVGGRRHRVTERRPWYAIAAGSLCFVLGDGVYDVYQFVLHAATPFPSLADLFYLAGYPLLIVGVVGLTRRTAARGSRESYADAAIVTMGALAVSWHFLISSYTQDAGTGVFTTLVTFAYPTMDLGVLFIVVRGLVFGQRRALPLVLLLAAMTAMIVSDFAYDVLSLHGTYTVGDPLDAGWLANYALVAAAALAPWPAGRAAQTDAAGIGGGRVRLPLVALAGFVSPTILLLSGRLGATDVAGQATISLIVFALVVVRMRWLVGRIADQTRSLSDALARRDALESELRHQAFHDSLTGLANRALLHDRVDHALAAVTRTRGAVALCFCDLDGFKNVNDSLGHLAGDALLGVVGERLVAAVRPGDTVARLGGDEFAVLMEGVDGPAEVLDVARRIVAILREPMVIQGRRIALSVSVGVTIGDPHATTERLLSHADSAMYEAKAGGKDRLEMFEPTMQTRLTERLDLGNALPAALERNELFLQYQPQFSLRGGDLVGFEALVRWDHPRLGLITPDRFIPVAEETGHIVAAGRWVIESACEQAAEWGRISGTPVTIAANLSGRQLQSGPLVDDIRTTLALSGLAPHQLVLEITESVLIADAADRLHVLGELKKLGVRLAIDDFGTGYSSLSSLSRMPVDELKIDKSFVDGLGGSDPGATAFVVTILRLASSLGLHVVAEGIEREDQRAALADLGCDTGQGFYFARPLDPTEATSLLRACHSGARGVQRAEPRT